MAFGTEIVASVVTRLALFVGVILGFNVGNALEHLVQFREMINVILNAFWRVFDCRLNVDLYDVSNLVGGVDLALTTIAGVVDHQECLTVSSSHAASSTMLEKI